MSHDLSLFLEGGGGLRKTTLSLFKDVTPRLGGGGVKGKSDNVTLFAVFFWTASLRMIQSTGLIQRSTKQLTQEVDELPRSSS